MAFTFVTTKIIFFFPFPLLFFHTQHTQTTTHNMGLDVKEKNLLKFLTSFILPTTMSAYFVYKTFFPNNPLGFFGLISVSKFLFTTTLRPLYQKLTRVPKDVRKYGKWAIVTGSTSGIGERFCHRLAEKNMSILLISRTMSKLEAVAKDITTANPSVQTQCMAYDFGTADAKVTEKVSHNHSILRDL